MENFWLTVPPWWRKGPRRGERPAREWTVEATAPIAPNAEPAAWRHTPPAAAEIEFGPIRTAVSHRIVKLGGASRSGGARIVACRAWRAEGGCEPGIFR